MTSRPFRLDSRSTASVASATPKLRRLAGRWLPLSLVVASIGCSQNAVPESLPPQSLSVFPGLDRDPAPAETPSTREVAVDSGSSSALEAETPEVPDHTLVVIGDPEPTQSFRRRLMAASEKERVRRSTAARGPVAVITDENLAEYATGNVTFVSSPPEADDSQPREADVSPASDGGVSSGEELERAGTDQLEREIYWRNRARDARERWHDIHSSIAQLESRAEELRTRFYAADDPFVRDTRIKPQWDRALDRLAEARAAVNTARDNVSYVLEEGRRAGALPGWLREGLELEPRQAASLKDRPSESEIGEPVVLQP